MEANLWLVPLSLDWIGFWDSKQPRDLLSWVQNEFEFLLLAWSLVLWLLFDLKLGALASVLWLLFGLKLNGLATCFGFCSLASVLQARCFDFCLASSSKVWLWCFGFCLATTEWGDKTCRDLWDMITWNHSLQTEYPNLLILANLARV